MKVLIVAKSNVKRLRELRRLSDITRNPHHDFVRAHVMSEGDKEFDAIYETIRRQAEKIGGDDAEDYVNGEDTDTWEPISADAIKTVK